MARWQLFAANYNQGVMWVYENLQQWLAERDVDFVLASCNSEDEVIQCAKKANIYLAFRFKVTRKVISALPRLKLIMSSGIGYDHIDVQSATDHGIVVTNTALYNIADVVEHTLALILACGRKLHVLNHLARQGRWEGGIPVQPIHRFGEQTIGIIGFGNIGRALAQKVKALGFQALAFDPYVPINEMTQQGVEPVDLKELLARSDFVSLHPRLTGETKHLLGEEQFRVMKPTAFVINASRGPVIDEAALTQALKERWIAGAGLDVLEQEPPNPDNPLLAMDNVIITCHAAGTTVESTQDWLDEWKRIIEDFLAGYWPINVVNPDVRPQVSLRKRLL